MGVQAWDQLEEFMGIIISTGDISVEGFLEVGKADEKVVNVGGILLLCCEHTREIVYSQDSIHGVLIIFDFSNFFFEPMVFPGVGNGHVISFVQNCLTHGHDCR